MNPENEAAENLTPEEIAELEILLADYMTDGKLDFEKVKADSRAPSLLAKTDLSQIWFWTPEWQTKEREAGEDIAAGRYKEFDNIEDLLSELFKGE